MKNHETAPVFETASILSVPDASLEERVSVGHPVDVASGMVFTAWTDWKLRGTTPIRLRRFYSTASLVPTPLGRGWHTIWFMGLRQQNGAIVLLNDEGLPVRFPPGQAGGRRTNIAAQMEMYETADQITVYYWHHFERYVFERTERQVPWRLTGIENLQGVRVRIAYDEANRISEIQEPSGRKIIFSYDSSNCVVRMDAIAPEGTRKQFVRYEYDDQRNLVAAFDPHGHPIRYHYDEEGRLLCETNRLGARFHFEYDAAGRCVHTWGDGGYLERKLEFAASGRSTRVTNSRGAVTTYILDQNRSVTRVIDALGHTTRRVRSGGTVQKVDPRGIVSQQEYDLAGNLVRSLDPTGAATLYEYNDLHQCVARTNAEGGRWEFYYDDQGQPAGALDANGQQWAFECNRHGRITAVTNPRGGVTRFDYDRNGNRIMKRDPDGQVTRYDYDAWGNLTALNDRFGNRYAYAYDESNRLIYITSGTRRLFACRYDPEGNVVEVAKLGRTVNLDYSPWNQRVRRSTRSPGARASEPEMAACLFRYDTENNLVQITDAQGRSYRFDYDPLDRRIRIRYGNGSAEEFIRDAAGNIVEYRTGERSWVKFEYDAANRMVSKVLSSGEETKVMLDVLGRVKATENSDGKLAFEYDSMGNMISEVQGDKIIRRQFDSMQNCEKLDFATELQIAYTLDNLQRVVAISTGENYWERFEYRPRFTLACRRELANGVIETWEVGSSAGALTRALSRRQDPAARFEETLFEFDLSGSVTRIADRRRGERNFQFDEWRRLTAVIQGGLKVESFAHDLSDNIVSDLELGGRVFDERNRLLETSLARYVYEDDGLRLKVQYHDGKEEAYQFDPEGTLRSSVNRQGVLTEYKYDPFGRRIAKISGGRTTRFFWDGTVLLCESDAAGTTNQFFIFLPRSFRALAKIVQSKDDAGVKSDRYYYHLDLLGTPLELTNRAGTVVWRGRYSAFGHARVESDDPGLNPLRFPGQYYDEETGLHYNYNRYYDPRLGRYLTQDPIGFLSNSLNLFAYSLDPINRADPLGLDCGDPDAVHIYHGTLDEGALAETGFHTQDKYGGQAEPPFVCVSTDRRAAAEAIDPSGPRIDAQGAPAPAVLTGSMSREEWDRLHTEGHLTTNDYGGFGHGLGTTETKARTPEGVAALNRAFGLPGGD